MKDNTYWSSSRTSISNGKEFHSIKKSQHKTHISRSPDLIWISQDQRRLLSFAIHGALVLFVSIIKKQKPSIPWNRSSCFWLIKKDRCLTSHFFCRLLIFVWHCFYDEFSSSRQTPKARHFWIYDLIYLLRDVDSFLVASLINMKMRSKDDMFFIGNFVWISLVWGKF